MQEIERQFNDTYAPWNIRLPLRHIEQRRGGKIVASGWVIWYLFGSDEKGEYLDYYASHRMTSDQHVRIYASGERVTLPVISEFYVTSQDPEEKSRLEAEYFANNRQVARMLEAKGFGIEGDEPGGVQINRFLHVHEPEE